MHFSANNSVQAKKSKFTDRKCPKPNPVWAKSQKYGVLRKYRVLKYYHIIDSKPGRIGSERTDDKVGLSMRLLTNDIIINQFVLSGKCTILRYESCLWRVNWEWSFSWHQLTVLRLLNILNNKLFHIELFRSKVKTSRQVTKRQFQFSEVQNHPIRLMILKPIQNPEKLFDPFFAVWIRTNGSWSTFLIF